MSVTEDFRADNLEALLPLIGQLTDIDAPVFRTSEGVKVSMLWTAAFFDAESVARYLVRQGANPLADYGTGAASATAAGNGGFRALRGMVRGGFSPDALTMFGLWKGNFEADLPISGLGALGHQLSGDPKITNAEDVKVAQRLIKKAKPFQESFGLLRAVQDAEKRTFKSLKGTGVAFNASPVLAEMAATRDEAAMALSVMLVYGRMFVVSEVAL